MNDEELKRLWCKQKLDLAKFPPGDQIKVIRQRMKLLDRTYLWVDLMSIVATVGVIVFLFFATWSLLKMMPVVARVGMMIMIASLGYDIWKPIRARRLSSRQPPADAPVTEWLRHELEKERGRHELTHTMLLGESLPYWIGMMVMTWGLDVALWSKICFSAAMTGIWAIIYVMRWKLNRYTRRKAARPLIAELESLLQANTPESPDRKGDSSAS